IGVEGEQKTESKENLEKRAHDLVTGMWRFEFALLKKKSKIDDLLDPKHFEDLAAERDDMTVAGVSKGEMEKYSSLRQKAIKGYKEMSMELDKIWQKIDADLKLKISNEAGLDALYELWNARVMDNLDVK